jgi:microcystin degradation protein MlrC
MLQVFMHRKRISDLDLDLDLDLHLGPAGLRIQALTGTAQVRSYGPHTEFSPTAVVTWDLVQWPLLCAVP